jgi:uncharacterized protein
MTAFIFDASAIVKRYVQEVGTDWVRTLADPAAGHEIFLTRITRVEVTAAVVRREHGGNLPGTTAATVLAEFRYNAAHQYNILEITTTLLTDAERLAEVYAIRGYDAVQLAATVNLHRARVAAGLSPLTFISSDRALNNAAAADGLNVDDPRQHPCRDRT